MKNRYLLFTILLYLKTGISFSQFITNHNAIPMLTISQPMVAISFNDPSFNVPVMRITNARNDGATGYFPDYAKRQAWNVDETKMDLRSASGDLHIFNGQTYQYINTLSAIQGVQDIFWHPTDPLVMYYFLDNIFYSINVQTEIITPLYTFSSYTYVSATGEGNLSNDGRYVVVAGYNASYEIVDFLIFDIVSNNIVNTFNVFGQFTDFDWASISPLGNYVVIDYANTIDAPFNGLEVYDTSFNFIWRQPIGAGHSDMGLDIGGTEVLIMDAYDVDSNRTYINKYNLSNGSTTSLLDISPDFDQHESCRNMNRPGWAYISTFDYVGLLTDDSLTWQPFEDEVFALNMDGSGLVQRYNHHHSRRYSPSTPNSDSSVYFAEPHATVTKNGDRILYGSNWRLNMDQDTSIDAYIIDLRTMIGIEQQTNIQIQQMDNYPNPFSNKTQIRFSFAGSGTITIKIFDSMGNEVKQLFSGQLEKGNYEIPFNGSNLSSGIYYCQLQSAGFSKAIKLIIQR